jgi:hypothetical protein
MSWSMSRSSLLGAAPVLALLSACGPGILSPKTPPPPLFFLEVEAQNALVIEGPVRGALAWSVYSDELVTCMDAVEVDGLIELTSDDPFDPAYQLVAQIQSCVLFSDRGHAETASVAVEAEFPASFTIPVSALPDESVLTGSDGARLGIGDVIVYVDDNGDALFTETALGADAFVDRVVGTSRAFREDDLDESFIVYREGDLSSVWKVYRGMYGCADPPQGFSTVTLRALDDPPFVECVIDDAVVPVELDESGALDGLACVADPDQHTYQRPGDEGLPLGSVGECLESGDGWYDVAFTVDIDSVCPDIGRYDLYGCSDLTSADACRASSWDLRFDEPAWWPCKFSGLEGPGEPFLVVVDEEAAVTPGVDVLFAVEFGDGFGVFPLSSLSVSIVIDDEGSEVPLDIASADALADNDDNDGFSTGDVITVREPADRPDLFHAASLPGNYLVIVRVDGQVVGGAGARSFQPVLAPSTVDVVTSGVDAPALISNGPDDVALVRYDSGSAGAFALDDVWVTCQLGGLIGVAFSTDEEQQYHEGTLLLSVDENGDGLFGAGDTLTLRERDVLPEGLQSPLNPEGLASFSPALYCNVLVDVGFDAFVYTNGFEITLE